jgi:hypothetical protein
VSNTRLLARKREWIVSEGLETGIRQDKNGSILDDWVDKSKD